MKKGTILIALGAYLVGGAAYDNSSSQGSGGVLDTVFSPLDNLPNSISGTVLYVVGGALIYFGAKLNHWL